MNGRPSETDGDIQFGQVSRFASRLKRRDRRVAGVCRDLPRTAMIDDEQALIVTLLRSNPHNLSHLLDGSELSREELARLKALIRRKEQEERDAR